MISRRLSRWLVILLFEEIYIPMKQHIFARFYVLIQTVQLGTVLKLIR